MSETIVIFRQDRDGGIFALFPEIPATVGKPWLCLSYQHVGQHSAADPSYCILTSFPAPANRAQQLAQELQRIGYELLPVRRITREHHQRRYAAYAQQCH